MATKYRGIGAKAGGRSPLAERPLGQKSNGGSAPVPEMGDGMVWFVDPEERAVIGLPGKISSAGFRRGRGIARR